MSDPIRFDQNVLCRQSLLDPPEQDIEFHEGRRTEGIDENGDALAGCCLHLLEDAVHDAVGNLVRRSDALARHPGSPWMPMPTSMSSGPISKLCRRVCGIDPGSSATPTV